MNIDFIADISCLWSYIAWRQLQTALRECAVEADIVPCIVSSGLLFPKISQAFPDRKEILRRRLSPLLEENGIYVNFDTLPDLSEDISLCARLIKTAFSEKKYKLLDDIFNAYFAFGRDVSTRQTLQPIADYYKLDLARLNAVPPFLPSAVPEGLRTVPCTIFNGTSVIFGAQGVPCLKNIIRLNAQMQKENLF